MATWGPTLVSAGADDAHEEGEGTFYLTEYFVQVQAHTDPSSYIYVCGGLRWQNVTIPKGAVISSAILSVRPTLEANDDVSCKIYGNLVGNAQNFSDNAHIISTGDRPRTTEYVSWVADSLGTEYVSPPDLKDPVQEIINHADWASGNALVLLLIANVVVFKNLKMRNYEETHTYCAKLAITYEEAPPPAAKTLVQAALISIPPLVVLPILGQILKLTGGC